jgi:predicted small metal-binding protein
MDFLETPTHMKQFSCGDVIPGCSATFRASSEDEILKSVAEHANKDHGISSVPDELVAKVRSLIRPVATGA